MVVTNVTTPNESEHMYVKKILNLSMYVTTPNESEHVYVKKN